MPIETFKLTGLLTTLVAVSYACYTVLKWRMERATVRQGLDQALAASAVAGDNRASTLRLPFAKRIVVPRMRALASLVYRLGPKGLRDHTSRRLVQAGLSDRLDADTFYAISVAAPVATSAVMLTLASTMEIPGLLWIFVPASASVPKMWLTRKVEARQTEIRLALADTLDLLTIAVEAGLGFDAAVTRVAQSGSGPLNDELYRMLQELKIGVARPQAFRGLAERANVPELDQLVTGLIQADSFGIAIGKVLRIQASQLREKRSQLAQERAAKTPVKLLFPLLLCIFPGLFTVLVGPAAIRIMERLFTAF